MYTIIPLLDDESNTDQTQPDIEQQDLFSLEKGIIYSYCDDEANAHQTQPSLEKQVLISLNIRSYDK